MRTISFKERVTLSDLSMVSNLLEGNNQLIWLFIGDSVTQGAKHTWGFRSYSEIFSERIRWEMGRNSDFIINAGINGGNSKTLLNNFEWGVAQFNPTVVFIMCGLNDCQPNGIRLSDFDKNIYSLIKKIRALGAIPILQTPNYINEESLYKYNYKGRNGIRRYIAQIRKAACENKIILIDHWEFWSKNNYKNWLDDPLHPNYRGHVEISKLIFKEISIYDPNFFTCSFND
jgi:lysophospholipase L1-like esterase